MKLMALKDSELSRVAVACELMLAATDLLMAVGVMSPNEEYDLEELSEAAVAEGDRRAEEDLDFYVAIGKVRKVIRPDGQIGYEPIEGEEGGKL